MTGAFNFSMNMLDSFIQCVVCKCANNQLSLKVINLQKQTERLEERRRFHVIAVAYWPCERINKTWMDLGSLARALVAANSTSSSSQPIKSLTTNN